jgi:hypothetical protein
VVPRVLVGPFALLLLFHIALRFWRIDSVRYRKPDHSIGRTEGKSNRARASNFWAYLVFRLISDWRCSTFASKLSVNSVWLESCWAVSATMRLKAGPSEYLLAARVTCNRGFCYGCASSCCGSIAIRRSIQVFFSNDGAGGCHGVSGDLGNRHRG